MPDEISVFLPDPADPWVSPGQHGKTHLSLVPSPKFELHARLVDNDGRVLPEFKRNAQGDIVPGADDVDLQWQWIGGAADLWDPDALVSDRRRLTVQSPSFLPNQLPVTGQIEVRWIGENARDTATVTFYDTAPLADDQVWAPHVDGDQPAVTVLEGTTASAGSFELVALTNGAHFANLGAPPSGPSRATVLRAGHPPDIRVDAWTNLAEKSGSSATLPAEQRELFLSVWIAAPDPNGELHARVQHEINLANEIYAGNRAGIRFSQTGTPSIGDLNPESIDYNDEACIRKDPATMNPQPGPGVRVARQIFTKPNNTPLDFDQPKTLYVVYLEGVAANWGDAFACAIAPGFSALIVMDVTVAQPTLLAHELGHILGLRTPYPYGHVESIQGFEAHARVNVMSDLQGNWQNSLDHLTIAQAYWVNLAATSWLNQQTPPAFPPKACSTVPAECPGLALGIPRYQ